MSQIDKILGDAVKKYTEKHGFRIVGTGYLGRNDGTNTCKDANFLSTRKMYYYTKNGGKAQKYSSAILWEGSGIIYEDSAANKDKAVSLGYIPNDTRLYILGGAGVETYNSSNGQTGVDQKAAGGTVTSVALTAPAEFSVTGSPVTGAGTLALAWANASGILTKRPVMWHRESIKVTGAGSMTHIFDGAQEYATYSYILAANNGDVFSNGFVIAAGTYTFFVLGETSANAGKVDWALDGASAFASGQDWFGTANNVTKTVGSVTISTPGWHKITGTINGKNAGSGGYELRLTKFGFIPSAD